jgi:K+-sensing histidine kinase KdpD
MIPPPTDVSTRDPATPVAPRLPGWFGWVAAVVIMGIALWASVFLREVLSQTRLVLLFAGVVAAVSTGGLGPGLLAIAMAAVGARLMLIDPDM